MSFFSDGPVHDSRPVGGGALSITNGVIVLEGGDLVPSLTNQVTFGLNNKITDLGGQKLSFRLSRTSGLFSGSLADSATGELISFGGVVLQRPNIAEGFFLGSDQSGSVYVGQ